MLVAGAAFGLLGTGVLVVALARRGGGDATHDAGVIAQAPDARAVVPATVDALDRNRDDDRKAIHLALIDHDWKLGLAKCREWGDYPRVDIVVQCTVFACIGKDDAKLERWVGGIPSGTKMREYIARFCERYRKPD